MAGASARWARQVADWAVPAELVDAAPRMPLVFTPEIFAAPEPGTFELTLSSRRAAEALADGGSVLDVGCGGGVAAFAVTPPATEVIGTDRQTDMLDLFSATARQRGITAGVVVGSWPDVAGEVPVADVVVCHNVLYNAVDIEPFVAALDAHARRRVVVEITPAHPQARRRTLWRHFWGLERPHGPVAADAVEAIVEAGLHPVVEESLLPEDRLVNRRTDLETDQWRHNLCLPEEREAELAALLAEVPFPRKRVTIWWDVDR